MKALSMRVANVVPNSAEVSDFFDSLGLARKEMPEEADNFEGSIHLIGDSWLETWQSGEQMPAGIMLQIVVDDADACAEQARSRGLEPSGPMDAHGERIYVLTAPGGLNISFQSAL
ncbi:MAG: hypothetical protein WBW44_04470 [Solirubrobacterales bacterium]